VTKVVLIVAAVADIALAALLIGVSGFILGGGPESMNGSASLTAAYVAAIIACIAAPAAGFILDRRGQRSFGLALALMPLAGGLAALLGPAP
jgi:hypothetical protein